MQRNARRALLGITIVSAFATTAHDAAAVDHPTFLIEGQHILGSTELRSPDLAHQNTGVLAFSFRFDQNDHKPGFIGFIPAVWVPNPGYTPSFVPSNDRLLVAFSDDADDPFDVKVRYVKLPNYGTRLRKIARSGGVAAPACKDECTLTIDGPPQPGDQFILQGFRIEKGKSVTKIGDSTFANVIDPFHNIRRIAIKLQSDKEKVKVMLRDDTSGDDVRVSIMYSYLAREHVERFGTATAEKPKDTRRQRLSAPGVVNVIQGFDFNFTNGDHHLREFSAESVPGGFDVTYNDNNLDDPASLSIEYVTVKGSLAPVAPRVLVRPRP